MKVVYELYETHQSDFKFSSAEFSVESIEELQLAMEGIRTSLKPNGSLKLVAVISED